MEKHAFGDSCAECWGESMLFTGTEGLCNKCGAYLSDKTQSAAILCGTCDDHFYSSAVSVGIYSGALRTAVLSLKASPYIPETLQSALISRFHSAGMASFDVIIPVPLSKLRRAERGFNQAEIIARLLSDSFALPLDSASLERTIHTPMHRAAMDKKARERTVKNAFQVSRPKLIHGKSIILIDDIFTSGATASQCARVLKKSGAVDVNVFTLARAVAR